SARRPGRAPSPVCRSRTTVPATAATPTLPLHDALPIAGEPNQRRSIREDPNHIASPADLPHQPFQRVGAQRPPNRFGHSCLMGRSEEHTSELQSRENLVCRLLLEKKKNTHHTPGRTHPH